MLVLRTLVVALAVAGLGLEASSASEGLEGRSYYVSPSGADTDPGTLAQPFGTIRKGIKTLSPGDSLYIRGGTYSELIKTPTISKGTPLAPIRVEAYPGERPVLEGLLWLRGADYWTLRGLSVTWGGGTSWQHMVKMINGIGWTIEDSEIWGARSFANVLVVGNAVGKPAGWTIRGNCIHDTYPTNGTNQDHNIYLNTKLGAGSGLIERNLLFNAENGENVKIGSPGVADSGSSNVTVRYNTMHNAAQNVLVGQASANNVIEHNIFSVAESASIRGYRLSGIGNIARDNIGFEANKLISSSPDYVGVVDGGGNAFPIDPQFDSVGCQGLHPQNPLVQEYGRYAP